MHVIWQWTFSIITFIGTLTSVLAWWNVRSITMFQKKEQLGEKLKQSKVPLGETLIDEAKLISERDIYNSSTKTQVLRLCTVLNEYKRVMSWKQRRILAKLHTNISYYDGRKNVVAVLLTELGGTFTDLKDILRKEPSNEQ